MGRERARQGQQQSLLSRKEQLQQEKPTADKQQLSYEESLQFGEPVKQYEKKLQGIEVQIQKLTRELNALKKQAKKLLPVSIAKVRVLTYSDDDTPGQTYCVKHIEKEGKNQEEEHFYIERLQ